MRVSLTGMNVESIVDRGERDGRERHRIIDSNYQELVAKSSLVSG